MWVRLCFSAKHVSFLSSRRDLHVPGQASAPCRAIAASSRPHTVSIVFHSTTETPRYRNALLLPPMLIQSEFDIRFDIPINTAMIALLHVHPSLDVNLKTSDALHVEHTFGAHTQTPTQIEVKEYFDSFGNRCSRFMAPAGTIRLSGNNIQSAPDTPDIQGFGAPQTPVEELPPETLQFLLASRYCQVDQFGGIAQDLFGFYAPGWERAAAIRDWVHNKVIFNYKSARSTKTAMDLFTERVGVCRDFQHLAVTLTRCMNIPARYVTGHLGDIRSPYSGAGDYSAWYQVWLDGKWWNMDARHNNPRYGRVLMATGRDAADVAITTSFGRADLKHFYVESNEIDAAGNKVPLMPSPPQFGAPIAPPAQGV
jgi:transglutaminase-like putative cysteine protease